MRKQSNSHTLEYTHIPSSIGTQALCNCIVLHFPSVESKLCWAAMYQKLISVSKTKTNSTIKQLFAFKTRKQILKYKAKQALKFSAAYCLQCK